MIQSQPEIDSQAEKLRKGWAFVVNDSNHGRAIVYRKCLGSIVEREPHADYSSFTDQGKPEMTEMEMTTRYLSDV